MSAWSLPTCCVTGRWSGRTPTIRSRGNRSSGSSPPAGMRPAGGSGSPSDGDRSRRSCAGSAGSRARRGEDRAHVQPVPRLSPAPRTAGGIPRPQAACLHRARRRGGGVSRSQDQRDSVHLRAVADRRRAGRGDRVDRPPDARRPRDRRGRPALERCAAASGPARPARYEPAAVARGGAGVLPVPRSGRGRPPPRRSRAARPGGDRRALRPSPFARRRPGVPARSRVAAGTIPSRRTSVRRFSVSMQKTWNAKPGEVARRWYVVDAEGQTLGRLATRIADTLRGKGKPEYTPHVDTGDFVVVVNAEKIQVTGNKLDQKLYRRHSGYPGGLRSRTLRDQLERRPTEVIRKAVKGMLPRNKLARAQINKLKIYAGPEHPHSAQSPEPLETQ